MPNHWCDLILSQQSIFQLVHTGGHLNMNEYFKHDWWKILKNIYLPKLCPIQWVVFGLIFPAFIKSAISFPTCAIFETAEKYGDVAAIKIKTQFIKIFI